MLDGEVSEEVETVWGFAVPPMPNGRRKWPEALRAMAVERIEAGANVREIAEEIGAHQSLVAVWVKNARPGDAAPTFFEVLPPTSAKSGHNARSNPPVADDAASCRISIGDADVAIPPGYPTEHLTEILRAVRSSQ